jgi:hypothetical protein
MWKFKRTREHEYLTGIPARDLTDEEVAALSAEDMARLEASGLYRHVDDEPQPEVQSGRRRGEKGGGD